VESVPITPGRTNLGVDRLSILPLEILILAARAVHEGRDVGGDRDYERILNLSLVTKAVRHAPRGVSGFTRVP